LIGIESCGGAHYWGREFKKLGHEVRLIHPKFVKPFVKTNKNDFNDAEAIAEAVSRENLRFVPVKEEWQQEMQAIHCMRERIVRDRTALINEVRGILYEYGVIFPRNVPAFLKGMTQLFAVGKFDNSLLGKFLEKSINQFHEIQHHVEWCDGKIKEFSKSQEICQRIEKIEGVGPITSTALVASIGDFHRFRNARNFSAALGLVPRQHSTGGKARLYGISKRGNPRLRTLMIHGARAALIRSKDRPDRKSQWAKDLYEKKGLELSKPFNR